MVLRVSLNGQMAACPEIDLVFRMPECLVMTAWVGFSLGIISTWQKLVAQQPNMKQPVGNESCKQHPATLPFIHSQARESKPGVPNDDASRLQQFPQPARDTWGPGGKTRVATVDVTPW